MSFCVVHTLHRPVHLVEAKYFEVFEITPLYLEERFYPLSHKRSNSPEWLCKSDQEYIRDKSVQPHFLVCITTFFENDVVKRHVWAW